MPRKRADGKQQINSWVDAELASDIEVIKKSLGLTKTSDVIKKLLELGIKNYGNSNNTPISKNRTGTKKAN